MRIEIIKKNKCPNLINQIYTHGINRFSYVSTGSTKMLTKRYSFWEIFKIAHIF